MMKTIQTIQAIQTIVTIITIITITIITKIINQFAENFREENVTKDTGANIIIHIRNNHNPLTTIEGNAFQGLKKLREL